jgi:hypothetical protein
MFDNDEYDWREALRVVGLSDEYISKYNDVPVLHITREEDIAPWSPDIDSSNPFVAVQKLLTVEGRLNRTMITSEAFWAGSEESTKFWPNMLLGCLRKTERYIKDFVYPKKNAKDRVMTWLERGLLKHHFPGAPHITVDHSAGYNVVGSFRTTEWTPVMLSTEAIPSSKTEERLWASTLLAILGYAYYVHDLKLEDERSVFTSRHREDKSIIMDAEKEMQDLAKEALSFLSGKKGIQFIPPRPGYELPGDHFLIPSFPTCSKKEWTGQHFVLALAESSWILSAGEKEYSKMMVNFRAKCDTQALEGAHPSPRGEAKAKAGGAPPRIPKNARKDLRKAAREDMAPPEGQPSSSARRSTSTGSASGTWDEANWEEQPWSRTSDTWSTTRGDQWEPTSGTRWSESTQWDKSKGKGPHHPKGKGGSKGSKGQYKGSKK